MSGERRWWLPFERRYASDDEMILDDQAMLQAQRFVGSLPEFIYINRDEEDGPDFRPRPSPPKQGTSRMRAFFQRAARRFDYAMPKAYSLIGIFSFAAFFGTAEAEYLAIGVATLMLRDLADIKLMLRGRP